MNRTTELNKSQAEHSAKHNLGAVYSFDLVTKNDDKDYTLAKEDLNEDYSLPNQFETFKAVFHGDNWSSKKVQFEKLIKYIK